MEICCMAQETQIGALYQPRGVGWEGERRKLQEGEHICIPMTYPCWGLSENNKIL